MLYREKTTNDQFRHTAKEAIALKQDIILISSQAERLTNVCKALKRFGVYVSQIGDIESANAGLSSYSPAFLLLDGDMVEIESFLTGISRRSLFPPPYII